MANVTVTNNGATVDNNGKLGKCYNFNGSQYISITIPNLTDYSKTQCSMCVWVKFPSYSSGNKQILNIGTSSGWGNIRFGILYRTGSPQVLTSISNGSSYVAYNCSAPIIENEWNHIAAVYNNKTLMLYVNGSIASTFTTTYDIDFTGITQLGIGAAPNGMEKFTGLISDVRLYDEALSPKQIKLLSQGLILHYTLSRVGGDNLYTGSKTFSGTWNNLSYWQTSSETYQGFTVKQKSSTWGGLSQNISCTNGDIFTISFYAKVQSGGRIASIHRSSLGNVSTGLEVLDGNFISGNDWITPTNDGTSWKKYWATLKIVSADITYLQWRIENSISNKTLYICGMKLEKGNKPTPWIPNINDSEYAEMGFNDGIEYDVSGYRNNGTKTGTITYDVDTPRYWTSSKFSSCDISTDPLPSSVITISFWYKPLSGSSYIVFADTGTGLCFGRENDHINTGISSTARADTISSSGFVNNSWYHIVIVKKSDTGRDVYVNGQKVDIVGNNFWTNDMPGLFIGKRKASNASLSPHYLNGNIVDFRAYVTALSEADILTLYNTPISLSSNGTLLTSGELTEV